MPYLPCLALGMAQWPVGRGWAELVTYPWAGAPVSDLGLVPCWLALATPAATCDGLALRGPAGLAYKRSGGAFDASHYSDKALNEDLSLQPSGELWCWRPTGCTYDIYVSLQLRVGGLAAARHQGRSAIAVAVPVPGKVLPVFVLAVIKGMHEPAAQARRFGRPLAIHVLAQQLVVSPFNMR